MSADRPHTDKLSADAHEHSVDEHRFSVQRVVIRVNHVFRIGDLKILLLYSLIIPAPLPLYKLVLLL